MRVVFPWLDAAACLDFTETCVLKSAKLLRANSLWHIAGSTNLEKSSSGVEFTARTQSPSNCLCHKPYAIGH